MIERQNESTPFAEQVKSTCRRFNIRLRPEIGQHLLIDEEVIRSMLATVPEFNTVIEIGAGIGQLTERIARAGKRVIAIEIDRQFEPPLQRLKEEYPNLTVIFKNVLLADLLTLVRSLGKEVWLVGNLPYHITEPLFMRVSNLPIDGATFIVGARFAEEIQAKDENSSSFGKLTLLAGAFFNNNIVARISKKSFYPQPRVESSILMLTSKNERELLEDKTMFLFRQLFVSAPRNPLVKNALKEALIMYEKLSYGGTRGKRRKRERNKYTRRKTNQLIREIVSSREFVKEGDIQDRRDTSRVLTQGEARALIESLNIPSAILGKPVEQMSNSGFRILYTVLRRRFE